MFLHAIVMGQYAKKIEHILNICENQYRQFNAKNLVWFLYSHHA